MTHTEALRLAVARLEDILKGDDGQAWKEAEKAMPILRAALATPSGEPDMRHPKVQALIGSNARKNIELQLVEQLLDNPDCDLSAMDMEYWHGLHDKLREKLLAAQPAPAGEPVAYMMVNKNHRLSPQLQSTPPIDWHPSWEAIPLYTAPEAP
jgi:hypothetical protein